jgi:hypothetical protein
MPERHQKHGGIAVPVSVCPCGPEQFLDLRLGQMLAGPERAIRPAPRGNCSFYGGRRYQP